MFCALCGKPNDDMNKFCTSCGNALAVHNTASPQSELVDILLPRIETAQEGEKAALLLTEYRSLSREEAKRIVAGAPALLWEGKNHLLAEELKERFSSSGITLTTRPHHDGSPPVISQGLLLSSPPSGEEIASIDEPSVSEVSQVMADVQSPELVASKKELLSAQRRFDEELKEARREVDFALIKSIGFNVYEDLGTISGYVVFYDKGKTQCSTRGNLSIRKEVTEYEKQFFKRCYTCFSEQREVPVIKERSVKTVSFHPDDFVSMQLQNGSEIYALPLKLDPDEIKKGDVVILEYRSFKEKKEIY